MRNVAIFAFAAIVFGCAKDELRLESKIDQLASVEVRAPKVTLRGGCELAARDRFCAEEYEVIGVIDLVAQETRVLTISDTVDDDQCTNVLWLRLVHLGDVGPVEDEGTLFQLPTDAELEQGAGALHSVAFPQATVRLDEVGAADENQSQPPPTCASLGKNPR